MYTQLVIHHFANSVPNVVHVPVPARLRDVVSAILILRNPEYPRHFLNGCYLILRDATGSCRSTLLIGDDGEPNLSDERGFWCIMDSLLSLVRCPENSRHLHPSKLWTSTSFSCHLPLSLNFKFLGIPFEPNNVHPENSSLEGPSLVLSLRPTVARRVCAAARCYMTQLTSNSWLIDGSDYFRAEYPAKGFITHRETTLAWVYGGISKPVGYVQYISHEDEGGGEDSGKKSQALITGLAVEEAYRRRGFARALICSAIHRLSHCEEIWISVREENHAALSLYLKCGFLVRSRQWDLSLRSVIKKT